MSLKRIIGLLTALVMTAGPSSISITSAGGKTKVDEDSHVTNTRGKEVTDTVPLFPAVKDGKYGFIDIRGQFVIPPSFTNAGNFSEGLAAVLVGGEAHLERSSDGSPYITSEGGKWGYIDRTGAMAIPPQFGSAMPFSEGLALVTLARDSNAPSLDEYLAKARPLNPSYSDAELTEYWEKTYDRKQPVGYIDTNGIFKIIPQYENYSSSFKNGMAHVRLLADKPDYLNETDETVLHGMRKELERQREGFWIDTSGREIEKIKALGAVKVNRFVFKQTNTLDIYGGTYEIDQYGLKDAQGHIVVKPQYESIGEFYSGGDEKAYSVTEACIVTQWKIFREYPFDVSRRCGLIDPNGNRIAPLQFDGIRVRHYEDMAIFTVGCKRMELSSHCELDTGRKGVFSIKERKIIVNPQYEEIHVQREGLIAVRLDRKWGFIDSSGKSIILPQFTHASYFQNGLAQVGLADYIDKAGRYVYKGSLGQLTFKPKALPTPSPDVKEDATASLTGTGFIVSRQGQVLTNYHIIKGCSTIRTVMEGRKQSVTIIGTDVVNDLALLQLPSRVSNAARFREGRTIRAGDGVVVVGFPLRGLLASEATVSTGIVNALAGIGNDTRFLQISAPIQPGNSGGPLLDHADQIVGVVVSKLDALRVAKATGDIPQNISFAINGTVAKAFLDANGVEYETGMSTRKMEPAEIGAIAKQSTLPLECFH
jgi:S1-C subfamily serine protease